MTTASEGMQAALARSASGQVVALGEMAVDELLASLSDEQKTGLSAALPANAAAPDPESDPNEAEPDGDPDDDTCPKCKGPMKDGKCQKCGNDANASIEAGAINSNASINERVKAVAAAVASDDACKGKASLALAMLADDDFAGLSASAMVKMIGQSGGGAAASDPEAAARDEMKAVLGANRNSNVNANSGAGASAGDNHSTGWAKATAAVNQRNGFKA